MTRKEARRTEEEGLVKRAQVWALRTPGSGPGSALRSHLISLSLNSLTHQTRSIIPTLVTPIRVVMRIKWGNVHKDHSGKNSHGSKQIYIQVLFSDWPGRAITQIQLTGLERKVFLSILSRRMTDELQQGFLALSEVMDHCQNFDQSYRLSLSPGKQRYTFA